MEWVPAAADVVFGEAQVAGFTDETLGESDLGPPVLPGQRDRGRIGHGVAEGPVVVIAGALPVASRSILASHHLAEPVPLGVREVTHQPEQREVGRLDRTAGHGTGVEACALELPGQPGGVPVTADDGAPVAAVA